MKNFIFVFILFALLLTVNAVPFQLNKRTTSFSPCPFKTDPLNVTISPDPPESGKKEIFSISGTLTNHKIKKDKTILEIMYIDLSLTPIGDNYNQTFSQSIKAGEPFAVDVEIFSTPQLPSSYYIGIAVGDPTKDPKKPLNIYACAYALMGESDKS
ncbi:hypothetical protein F8M41_010279 [Gigaspora margarita]|uniref:MD-2-related lipid-recognition domain-containing protein n=1 Tax=Gigaspora margarita TaxID=4874 RepID=A0A8H4A3E8_GIGMA|nr:hypothetical protein F8M41_010279 [Gigaspora margarita]